MKVIRLEIEDIFVVVYIRVSYWMDSEWFSNIN